MFARRSLVSKTGGSKKRGAERGQQGAEQRSRFHGWEFKERRAKCNFKATTLSSRCRDLMPVENTKNLMDCGGKRNATPLLDQANRLGRPCKSAVAAALCQRSPKPTANFTPRATRKGRRTSWSEAGFP